MLRNGIVGKYETSAMMLPNGIVGDTRLRVDAPERNRRKIRDSGLMLPNGIVEEYETPG